MSAVLRYITVPHDRNRRKAKELMYSVTGVNTLSSESTCAS